MKIFTLVCQRDVHQALACLGSLLRHNREVHELRLVDDGSLSEVDTARLEAGLTGAKVIRISPEETESKLTGHPQLRQARERFVMCRKLLDIPLQAAEPCVILDSDILFLRDFTGLESASKQHDFICMRDGKTAYSPGTLTRLRLRLRGERLIEQCNAGFLLVCPEIMDLDFLEYFFSRAQHLRHPALVEQTAWAILGARSQRAAYWDPEMVAFPTADLRRTERLVAWHFACDFRLYLKRALAAEWDPRREAPIQLETSPIRIFGVRDEVRRLAKHIMTNPILMKCQVVRSTQHNNR